MSVGLCHRVRGSLNGYLFHMCVSVTRAHAQATSPWSSLLVAVRMHCLCVIDCVIDSHNRVTVTLPLIQPVVKRQLYSCNKGTSFHHHRQAKWIDYNHVFHLPIYIRLAIVPQTIKERRRGKDIISPNRFYVAYTFPWQLHLGFPLSTYRPANTSILQNCNVLCSAQQDATSWKVQIEIAYVENNACKIWDMQNMRHVDQGTCRIGNMQNIEHVGLQLI